MLKTGCCGWAESQARYYQDFPVIEVQETFYQPGRIQKYEKWRAAAPADFEFIVKAWQLITHEPSSPTYRRLKEPISSAKKDRYGSFRATPETLAAWETTAQVAASLRARTILFQCPGSFVPSPENKENLRAFFTMIDRGPFTLAWEPRGSWEPEDIRALCEDLNLVHCVDPLKIRPCAGSLLFFRLHGLPGYDLDYKYTDEDLEKLLAAVDRPEARVMFNNLSMRDDARRFQRLAAARRTGSGSPDSPWRKSTG